MDLCKYKDILGEPGKGIHSYRLPIPGIPEGIAIVDVILTFLLAAFVSWVFNLNYLLVLVVLVVVGVILHRVFCVKTSLDKKLFGN